MAGGCGVLRGTWEFSRRGEGEHWGVYGSRGCREAMRGAVELWLGVQGYRGWGCRGAQVGYRGTTAGVQEAGAAGCRGTAAGMQGHHG